MDRYDELRYWSDNALPYLELSEEESVLDAEDSLSDRYAFQLGEQMGQLRFAVNEDMCREMQRGYEVGLTLPSKSADVYRRKLLTLRRNAYDRSIPVSSALTSEFLKSISVTVCPISGAHLTQGTMTDTDWSVDRLDNEAGYVPGNVCIMSTRVNRLKNKAQHLDLAHVSIEAVMREGPGALSHTLSGGLTVVETLRLAALTVGPYCMKRDLVARYLPFAMAPKTIASVDAIVAGIHLACARTHLEGRAYAKRVGFFKHLGTAQWRASNVLVRELRSALSKGEHPADMWFDGRTAMLLKDLTDTLLESPVLMSEVDAETAFDKVTTAMKPMKHLSR